MNRALREIDLMKSEAWRGFAGDVRATSRRMKKAGISYMRAHPLLVLGGGAALGALVVLRLKRRPKTPETPGILKVLRIARFCLGRAILLATDWAERSYLRDEESRG
jgi:hypothetical protein